MSGDAPAALVRKGGDLVDIQLDAENVMTDMDMAVPCGLIITELVSNALKHAFPDGRKGSIRVGRGGSDGRLVLSVSDDGVGFPPGIDVRDPATLGLRIVNILAAQLKTAMELDSSSGARFVISIPSR